MHFLYILSLTETRDMSIPVGSVWLLVPLAQSNLINFSYSSRPALHPHIFSNMNKSSSSESNQECNKKGHTFSSWSRKSGSRRSLSGTVGMYKRWLLLCWPFYAWHGVIHRAESVRLIQWFCSLSFTQIKTENYSTREMWLQRCN